MRLTDNEIRDITKYLEAGKPLPDMYRFLLFEEKREVELVWNGKSSEVCNVTLPFQIIEQVDEPRAESKKPLELQFDLFDTRGRQIKGWTNKLIWGDNKLILSSLKNGPLREEIEQNGGIKLIYIDPPFDVGADFSMNIEIGDEQFTKAPSVLEELAYRDTWGKGADSFIVMIYERLSLMRDLLAPDGSIYVHCDWRLNSCIRLVLEEIFSKKNYQSEIYWKRTTARSGSQFYNNITDSLLFFTKSEKAVWNQQYNEYEEQYVETMFRGIDAKGRKYRESPLTAPGRTSGKSGMTWRRIDPGKIGKGRHWAIPGYVLKELSDEAKQDTLKALDELDSIGRIQWSKNGMPNIKQYLDELSGVELQNIWLDIGIEKGEYPTQKPEKLLERIILSSSNEGDIVADFFCGSGTTLAVAEKLGRKWIGVDLGKFAIHTTRKRMISVQRELKEAGKDYRAFEILNLGKYERQHYIGVNPNLRDKEKEKQLAKREKDFLELILRAYRAEKVDSFRTLHGKKSARLVAVGPINLPVTRRFVEEIISECLEKKLVKIDILAFEFEMGLFPNIQEEAKSKGIDLALKYIPRDVFDKRAVEKNQVVFHDVSYIEVKPIIKKNSVAVQLIDFSVYYNQDTIANVEASLKNGGIKIYVENGKIIKVTKDTKGIIKREVLTKKWTDWIDYWAIDFDFESKKEIVRVKKDDGVIKEAWTGDYVFENEWQSFRTKKDRTIELKSAFRDCPKGRRKIAVKVVDIFGNDTMKVIEVTV